MNLDKKICIIHNTDSIYPESLKKITSSPKVIYAIGNIGLLNMKSIAVVGSRNSSQYGEKIAKEITTQLTKNDIVIVSGMAVGIDSVAHRACLEHGGKTIAVLGSGFKYIYPKENEKLFYDIIKNDGLLLSEFPSDFPVQMKNFPRRNRIISGLSLGVLVIEATYRSGTSITANYAKKQGKKVFCIPNCIGNKNSYGTINLAMKGATLVRNSEDILKELNLKSELKSINRPKQLKILDDKSKKIVNCIANNNYVDAEKISMKVQMDIADVNQILTLLEIDGVIIYDGKYGFNLAEAYRE